MALPQQQTGWTWDDLLAIPEDNLRREIIDGELFVSPSPVVRHQRAVTHFTYWLHDYARQHGGEVFPAPLDVVFSRINVVDPDVLFFRHDHLDRIVDGYPRAAPDLVVEVSSPSTRRLELVRKLELYQRFGVPEYVYVDLDADRVELYRLQEGSYGTPELLMRGDALVSQQLPGFTLDVDEILGPA